MRLNHIDLQVADVDAACAFWQTHFGFRVAHRRGGEIVLLKDEAGLLLGVSNLFGSPPPVYPPDFHLGFRLESAAEVQAIHDAMKAVGVPIQHPPQAGGPAFFFMCAGPDGIRVEVSGPRPGMEDAYWMG